MVDWKVQFLFLIGQKLGGLNYSNVLHFLSKVML